MLMPLCSLTRYSFWLVHALNCSILSNDNFIPVSRYLATNILEIEFGLQKALLKI